MKEWIGFTWHMLWPLLALTLTMIIITGAVRIWGTERPRWEDNDAGIVQVGDKLYRLVPVEKAYVEPEGEE